MRDIKQKNDSTEYADRLTDRDRTEEHAGRKAKVGFGTDSLATAPILKLMLAMGIPSFVAQLVNLLYNIVDRIYIGHIPGDGAMALTALGLCFPVITCISAFSLLAGTGGAPLAGIALGEGNRKQAEKILGNSFVMLLVLAVILTVGFQIIKRPFLYAFGASDVTYAFAKDYLTLYLFGTIFVMLSLGLNMFIMIQGEALIAMFSIVIGAVLNSVLDPLFIYVMHMGVRGAALGTIIAQAVSTLWVMNFLTGGRIIRKPGAPARGRATLQLHRCNLSPEGTIIRRILALGISPFIMGVTESLITVLFNRGAQTYGNDLYVGSITILQSITLFVFTPMNGFSQGVQSIISYNYGARNMKRVRKTCLTLITMTGCFSCMLTGIFMLFPRVVSSIFTTDQALIDICAEMLPLFMAGMLIFGLQSGSQQAFLALGKAKQSLFFACLRKVILLTPLVILLPKMMNSVRGIYYAEPISDAVSAICCVLVFLSTLRAEVKKYTKV